MGPEILLIVLFVGLADKWLAGADETIVLLPDEDGGIGMVAVNPGSNEIVLDEAGEAAFVDGDIKTATLSDEDINKVFGDAISARPQAAASYILYFLEGSTELEPGSDAVLANMFKDLNSRAAPDITIIGHTDRVGSVEANDRLALSRAETVLQWLAEKGISKKLMDAAGRGERAPLIPTEDGVEEAKNRRVEISIR